MSHPDSPHPDLPAEQLHLDQTVTSMLARIEQLEDRARNTGADLETSLTLADNATEQAATLSPHIHAPYFACLSVRIAGQDRTLYVGKHAHGDFGGPCSVIDWTSDVGGLFYSNDTTWTTRGKRPLSGTVTRKRQLDVERKQVRRVTDLYDAGQTTAGREAVLVRRLSEAAHSGMRDVIETLQDEQYAAVRAPAGTPLIVQGSAGSGKTTIGFHRLAYLCSPERQSQQATTDHCLVLMPNLVLANYAARVLPSLNLQGVNVTTPEAWMVSFLGLEKMEVTDRTLQLLLDDKNRNRRIRAWRRAKLLGSLKLLEVVRRHLQQKIRSKLSGQHLNTLLELHGQRRTVTLSEAKLQSLLESVFKEDPYGGYRNAFRCALNAEVNFQVAAATDDETRQVNRQLETELTSLLSHVFGSLTPVLEARHLLQQPEALQAAGQQLLSAAEIKLLLSDPLAAMPRPRRSYADVTELPLMLAVRAFLDGLGRKNGHQLLPYDELILDEAQDFSPALYALLRRAVRPGHITALGDADQGVHGYKSMGNWLEAQDALGGGEIMTLPRTYRSTREISQVTSGIAQHYSKLGPSSFVERSGEPVMALIGPASSAAARTAEAVKAALSRGCGNIAVVTRRSGEAERLQHDLQAHDVAATAILSQAQRYTGGVVTLPVALAKGLEFDACVVYGADAQTYDPNTEYECRLLYVTASRGLHELTLVATDALHPLLKLPSTLQSSPPVRLPELQENHVPAYSA